MSFSFNLDLSFLVLREQLPPPASSIVNGNFTVQIYPEWFRQVTLTWTVPANWGNVMFDIYYSPAYENDYVKLTAQPITANFFTDTTSTDFSKFKRGQYIVEAILLDKGKVTLRSDPISWVPAQKDFVRIRATEIQRREYLLLTKFVGIKSYLFRRKTFGKRCPLCWDFQSETVNDDHCPNCISTGFDGGFFTPSPIYLQYDATPNQAQKTYYGIDEEGQIGAWTISYPDISVNDVIVRTGSWDAYEVLRLTPTELQGNEVRQIMTLTQLSKGSVEYKLLGRNLPEFPTQYFS